MMNNKISPKQHIDFMIGLVRNPSYYNNNIEIHYFYQRGKRAFGFSGSLDDDDQRWLLNRTTPPRLHPLVEWPRARK